jgi:hypothetical protein
MNAPLNPALLAPSHEVRDLMLRVAEAVRIDAAIAARGDVLAMKMNGRQREAVAAHESAHSAVMRLDLNKLVAEFAIQAPDVTEKAAFEAAARAAHFSTMPVSTGDYAPSTQRAHAVWLAAVRWARKSDRPP